MTKWRSFSPFSRRKLCKHIEVRHLPWCQIFPFKPPNPLFGKHLGALFSVNTNLLADGRAINTFFDLLAPPPPSTFGVNPFGTQSLNIETRIFLGHIGEEFKGGRSFLETDTRN